MRTLLAATAVFAVIFDLLREGAIWYETRGFIEFHEERARWLRNTASWVQSEWPDFACDFRQYAAWHDERSVFYRRAHKTHFSDEMIEDFQQTEREQAIERVLYASRRGGAALQSPVSTPSSHGLVATETPRRARARDVRRTWTESRWHVT